MSCNIKIIIYGPLCVIYDIKTKNNNFWGTYVMQYVTNSSVGMHFGFFFPPNFWLEDDVMMMTS